MEKTNKPTTNPLLFWILLLMIFLSANMLFLFFIRNVSKTVTLLYGQLAQLEQDQVIVSSSNQLALEYKDDIELISQIFPNEETIPNFVARLEQEIRNQTKDYTFKFTAITPLKEQDKLFLPMTIMMKTDLFHLQSFLASLEQFNYMTHITSINTKSPDGFSNLSEITIGLKVYVQNPFTNK